MITRKAGQRSSTHRLITIGAILSVLLLLGVLLTSWLPHYLSNKGATSSREPISRTVLSTWLELTPQERIDQADLVLIGTVGQPAPSRWNTPTGRLPQDATHRSVVDNKLLIYTDYPVTVEETLKGSVSQSVINVRTVGGKVDQDSITGDGHVGFQPGERVVLLLTNENDVRLQAGPDHYRTVLGFQGKFLIRGEQAVVYAGEEVFYQLPLHTLKAQVRSS